MEEEQERFVEFVPAEMYRLKVCLGLLLGDLRLFPLLRYVPLALISTLSNLSFQECFEGCCDIIGDIVCEYTVLVVSADRGSDPNQAARASSSARESVITVTPIRSESPTINIRTMIPVAHVSFGESDCNLLQSCHSCRTFTSGRKQAASVDYRC